MKIKKIITIIIVICLMFLSFCIGRGSASPTVTLEEAQRMVDEAARASAASKTAEAAAQKLTEEAKAEAEDDNSQETASAETETAEDTDKAADSSEGNEAAGDTDTSEDSSEEKSSSEDISSEDASEDSTKDEKVSEDSGVDPQFKATMDSYEKFFAKYVTFMRKYQRADSSEALSMLADYSDFMTTYSKAMANLSAVDPNSLSDADLQYYLKIVGRINKKLAKLNQ